MRKQNETTRQYKIFMAIGVCELTNVKSINYLRRIIESYYNKALCECAVICRECDKSRFKTRTFIKDGKTYLTQDKDFKGDK